MKVVLEKVKSMDLGRKHGKMVTPTKATGKRVKYREWECSWKQTEQSIKEVSKTRNTKAWVLFTTLTEKLTTGNGEEVKKAEMELRFLRMEMSTLENSTKTSERVAALISFLMEAGIRGIFQKTINTDMEFTMILVKANIWTLKMARISRSMGYSASC